MAKTSSPALKDLWSAQAAQERFIKCPCFEVVYGGARGGGKTDACLGDWLVHAKRYGPGAKGLFLRKELPQLDAVIARSKELFFKIGGEWREQPKTWAFPNGAVLKFRPLERDDDAEKYQGHDYTRLYPEELTNWADAAPIMKMLATLRSGAGVPVAMKATCNPGGPGHGWVKARYIDNGAYEIVRDGQADRVFIPARVTDNPALMTNDPGYVDRLRQAGSEQLVRAWLEGDWDIIEGAFFTEWQNALHVVAPFTLPQHWARFRSFDWGFARPFSCGWWAVASEDLVRPEGLIPRGALVRYAEWYGASEPNKGLRLSTDEVADGIVARELERGERVSRATDRIMGVADPAIFSENGGPSMAEAMGRRGVIWRPADNTRVGKAGAMGGWDQVRSRLRGVEARPMLYVFSTCRDLIRTLPAMQHDRTRAEDIDSSGEDHIADEVRYACMSRPWVAPQPKQPVERDRYRRPQRQSDDWRTV